MQIDRRRFLQIAGVSAAALFAPGLAIASSRSFRWRNYGRQPFAFSRPEAESRLQQVLHTHFGAMIPRVAADLLVQEVRNRRPQTMVLRRGDQLTAMMSGDAREPAKRNVEVAFSEGFTAVADYWDVTFQRVRYRLILPLLGTSQGNPSVVETCYNWSIQVGFPRDCFDIPIEAVYADNRLLDRNVVFTVNIWRPAMSAEQIVAASRCGRPQLATRCPPCSPGWDYGGRGKPDLVYEIDVLGKNVFTLPSGAIRTAVGNTTEFLICSYYETFRAPNTQAGYGRTYPPEAVRALARQGGFTWQDAADFRKA